MFMCGAGGYLYLTGNVAALLNSLKNLAYARLSNYDLVVIPLLVSWIVSLLPQPAPVRATRPQRRDANGEIIDGDTVSEEQLALLLGAGRDPIT